MSLPGTTVTVRDSAPSRTPPTDTGVSFVTGLAARGRLAPTLVRSMTDFEAKLGERVYYSRLYDALQTAFQEGLQRAYVSRVVGGSATGASVILQAGTVNTLTVIAAEPGEYGNDLNAKVLNGGTIVQGGATVVQFKLEISHDTDGVLETSPALADKTAALQWAAASEHVTLVSLGGSTANPTAGTAVYSLSGGFDDRASVDDGDFDDALDRIPRNLGPGQVWAPGRTSSQAHQDLLTHAAANNRVALLDAEDTATVATLVAAADAARTDGRWGAMFAPWAVVPGIVGGTTRTVPYSAVMAGIIARNDARGNPNIAAAGDNGQALYAIGLSQPAWDDGDRETLNDAGVNVALEHRFGGVRTYGYRSLADPDADPDWKQFTNARTAMLIVNECDIVGESYVFAQIDGRGRTISRFQGDITGVLLRLYNIDALYGNTSSEAFRVGVGSDVNPPANLAQGLLRALVVFRASPYAERVEIVITKRVITEVV